MQLFLGHVQPTIRDRRIERPTRQCWHATRRGKRRESDRGGTRVRRESRAKAQIRRGENIHRRGERNKRFGHKQQAVYVRCWELGGTGPGQFAAKRQQGLGEEFARGVSYAGQFAGADQHKGESICVF